jgi:hypothetical protein
MKQKIYLIVTLAVGLNSFAQLNPTGAPPSPNNPANNANSAWYRGGNFPVGTSPLATNNIFGTKWNSPIFHQTNGINRMQMNGTVSNVINVGNSLSRDGFIGIGVPTGFYNGSGTGQGPFSLLHLNGINPAGSPQTFGYRDWMRYGITSTHNQDLMYIGQRATGGTDVTDAVIGWADNFGAPSPVGPDNLTFNFLTGAGQSGNDDLVGTANFGREIMRMTGTGQVGIGPRFNNSNQPKSTLHQHQENSLPSWMQITNQASPILNNPTTNSAGPTAITANDGLRWGIDGANIGYIYNQENKHLLFSTNHNAGTSAERMRITHIGAPGTPNPSNIFANDLTRVSISHDPANPVTSPLSLLHLGYNTQGATGDGWRPWMDVGMYVSQSSDNVFLGLKNESLTPFGDQLDAVLSWGDNQVNSGLPPFNGPDKFRFIFTSTQAASSPGSTQAKSANGLEALRMNPTLANGVYTGIGGDPTGNLYSAASPNPNNTLEVNSWGATSNLGGSSGLRLTNLTTASPVLAVNPGAGVLAVDANGDVVYVQSNSGTGVGNYCSATTPNPLTGDYEIPMNVYNYYYSGQGTGRTNLGVGLPCNTNLGGKVHAYQLSNNMMLSTIYGISVAGRFDNYTSTNAYVGYGVIGNAQGTSPGYNFGVFGQAANAAVNFAGYFQGDVYTTGGTNSIAGYLSGSDKNIKTNITTIHSNLEIINKLRPVSFKFDNSYAPQLKLHATKNYGFIAQEVETIIPELVNTGTVVATYDSIGNVVNPEKVIKSLNYDGLIPFAIGGIQELNTKQKEMQASLDKAGLSDAQVKTNVNSFNALAKIKTLNPVQYNFTNANVPQLTFKSNLDYGFVAQQLETVYPELVDTLRVDATYDSLGVVVNPSQVLKTVNYKAMAGLLVRSIQEQQLTIDSLRNAHSKQDSINNAVQQQLANLAALIDGCCTNNTTRNSNTNINQLDVELSDKDAIVLNQNVPNPFAEQTTITYNVPASVGKAQIIFFNNLGQVIQTVDIKTRGKGKVNVFASDLSSGLYNYTLVADGKVIDSKKMVRE